MTKHRPSVYFVIAITLAALTACASSPSAPPAPSAPPTSAPQTPAGALDVAASPATQAQLGIARWTGHREVGALGSVYEGRSAGGALRVQVSTRPIVAGQPIVMGVTLSPGDGTFAHGTLTIQNGKIVESSLPAHAADYLRGLHADTAGLPTAEDYNACITDENAVLVDLFWVGVYCTAGEVTMGTPCLVLLSRLNDDLDAESADCSCPACPDGYTCESGQCEMVESCEIYGDCGVLLDSCDNQVDLGGCDSDEACVGGYCQPTCDDECQCENSGGVWDGSECEPAGQCGGNPAVCYAACEAQGLECDENSCSCY